MIRGELLTVVWIVLDERNLFEGLFSFLGFSFFFLHNSHIYILICICGVILYHYNKACVLN